MIWAETQIAARLVTQASGRDRVAEEDPVVFDPALSVVNVQVQRDVAIPAALPMLVTRMRIQL